MPTFDCIARLNQAAGRALTDAEVEAIFSRIHKAALDIKAGRRTPQAGAMGMQGVIDAAAQEAAATMAAEAARAERNANLQVIKMAQRMSDFNRIRAGVGSGIDAVSRMIANKADGRADQFSLENHFHGVNSDMQRRVPELFEALGNDAFGFVQQPEKIHLLVREMRGERTGDKMAADAAKAWKDATTEFKNRFNDAGGNIGTIEDWGLPQSHSQQLVAAAGRDQWLATLPAAEHAQAVLLGTQPPPAYSRQVWVDSVYRAIDHSRYVDDAGVPWEEARTREFLGKAWDNISTDGWATREPGQFAGVGARANRGSEERKIHFASADAYMNYWSEFSGRTFPDIITKHIEGMARDIAFIEHFGPNPDQNYRVLRDMAAKQDAAAAPAELNRMQRQLQSLDALYDVAAGRVFPIANLAVGRVFEVLRDLNVAGKLGTAFVNSLIGDKVMMETMARLNEVPAMQAWVNELRLLNPANDAERATLRRMGLMADYLKVSMARWGDDLGASRWTAKLANSVMRVSGMNAINEWRRGSAALDMMGVLGREVAGKDFAAAKAEDIHMLKVFGIDEFTWKVWKLAQLDDLGHGNDKMLTPDSISSITDDQLRAANIIAQVSEPIEGTRVRQQAITRLLGVINSEARNSIIEPGWATRAMMNSPEASLPFPFGILPSAQGTLGKAFWQFKSFPLAQFTTMWQVSMSRPTTGGKVAAMTGIVGMLTLAGLMTTETKDILTGKDPKPIDWKLGVQAFLQGGALGIYGDFLYGINETHMGTGPLELFAGPTLGSGLDLLTSSMKAAKDSSEGKPTHYASHLFNIGKGFIPGNNLWFTKAATDHILMQNIQESLNPGYLARMRQKAMHDYHQDYWWQPGEFTPERAPDLGSMVPK